MMKENGHTMLDELKDVITPTNLPAFRPEMAFPHLTEEMVLRIRSYANEELFTDKTLLFERGTRRADMFVVLEGGIEVIAINADGESESVHFLDAQQFSGELNLLNAQKTLVGGRAAGDSRLLRVTRVDLQRLMRAEGDIANLIMQAVIWRRVGLVSEGVGGVTLAGRPDDAETVLLQRFLVRNIYPHRVIMADSAAKDNHLVGTTILNDDMLPAIVLADGRYLPRPRIACLADELGITELPEENVIHDVVVVGAGPSGLAAAVYAASEGLSTLVIEGIAPGGQAGTSSKIENYLGFPTGISGQRLATRAQMQALKFGVHFVISRNVVSISQVAGVHRLLLAGGMTVSSRAVIIATGAQYRKLSVEDFDRFENQGIYYAATAMESLLCRENEVIVVGGGNSAGQAAVFLSGIAKHVYLIVRASTLATTMSQYLISRIENSAHITVFTDSEIEELAGDSKLERVVWVNRKDGQRVSRSIGAIFVMIGAQPNSGWLYGTLKLDSKGFVITGTPEGFESTPYATSVPGIYAVGDVRANSVKRVASAVGEGSVAVSDVHRYLADHQEEIPADPKSALAALQSVSTCVHEQDPSMTTHP
jgi:thioredoxin reductase (NADPH)